jgi:hypothetical protein
LGAKAGGKAIAPFFFLRFRASQGRPNGVVAVDEQGRIINRKPLGNLETFSEEIGKSVTLEMVLIPSGRFPH